MRKFFAFSMLAAFMGFSQIAFTQEIVPQIDVLAATLPPPEGYPVVKGVVRRVDLVNMKLTVKHDEIPNLDMPAMTMPFSVVEQVEWKTLKAGDRIRFVADEINNVLSILWLEKVL